MAAPPQHRRITVEDAVSEFIDSLNRSVLGGNLSESTRNNYARDLTEFIDLAKPETVLDDLTADDLDDIVLAYAAQPDKRYTRTEKPSPGPGPARGRGPGAQARFRQALSRLFAHADRRGWVQMNPVPDMSVRPKVRGIREAARLALPQASAVALLEVPEAMERSARKDHRLSLRDTAILRVLLEVGPRVSELCAFDRADLSVRDGATWLTVRRGKGGKTRDLPLSPETTEAIQQWLASKRPSPPADDPAERRSDAERALFVSYRGRRIKPRDVQYLVDRAWKRLPAETQRAVTPHGLRHTSATLLLASGAADVKTVQSLLGHESLATTGLYLDDISQEKVRAVAAHPVTGKGSR